MSKETKKEVTEVKENAVTTAESLGFKIAKRVTLPLLKPQLEIPVFILITDPIFQGKKIESGTSKDMEPAHLANIVDLETGENAQIIIPSVLMGIFKDDYPENTYVGKAFQLTKHAKKSGKRYHSFTVIELEKA